MITARRSWRSRSAAALAAGLIALAGVQASAHRRDEYLQAARIGVEGGRVQIELDLTPGIAVAQRVLADIDRDQNGVIATDEATAYCARVLGDLRLEIDGRVVSIWMTDRQFPSIAAINAGEGTIQLQLAAAMPRLAAGNHRVFFLNNHRAEIGVYLANALAPANDDVAVLEQQRDVEQHRLTIDYALKNAPQGQPLWWLPAVLAAAIAIVGSAVWRRSRESLRVRRARCVTSTSR
jgi:hypothetical protein